MPVVRETAFKANLEKSGRAQERQGVLLRGMCLLFFELAPRVNGGVGDFYTL